MCPILCVFFQYPQPLRSQRVNSSQYISPPSLYNNQKKYPYKHELFNIAKPKKKKKKSPNADEREREKERTTRPRRGENKRASEQQPGLESVTGERRQRAPPSTPNGALSLRHTHTRLATARLRRASQECRPGPALPQPIPQYVFLLLCCHFLFAFALIPY